MNTAQWQLAPSSDDTEVVQANIVIGFNVPADKREAASVLLEWAAERAYNGIGYTEIDAWSDEGAPVLVYSLAARLAELGISLEDLRVDWD